MENEYKNIVLFDGVCTLCQSTVQFIIKRDRNKKFVFSSIQSPYAQRTLGSSSIFLDFKSVVYIQEGKYYSMSTAILMILKELGSGWQLLYGFIIIPRPIRDWIYRLIAKYRYRWFGKTNKLCENINPQDLSRIIS